MDDSVMGSKGVIIIEVFDTIFTRQSDTFHTIMDFYTDFIIVVTQDKFIAIITVFFHQLILCF